MRTIYTTLPVYDSTAKQCWERVKRANLDMMAPVITPRHRLPSLQWNVETDNPGIINSIELIDKNGDNAVNNFGFGEWKGAEWENVDFATFTTQGLNVTSGIAGAGGQYAYSQWKYYSAGEVVTLTGTYTKNSGNNVTIALQDRGTSTSIGLVLLTANGSVTSTATIVTSDYYRYVMEATGGVVNFALSNMAVSCYNFLNHFWDGNNLVSAFTNVSYDTFTTWGVSSVSFTATKTTAAGEASIVNTWSLGDFHTYTSKRIRVDCYLTFNGGATTKPKIELRDSATGLVTGSNTVTLNAGRNTVILVPTINTGAHASVYIYNSNTETTNFTLDIAGIYVDCFEPTLYTALTDDYFQYKGETLAWLLPEGEYYLKISTLNGEIYYSDYFKITCVYDNLITSWTNATYGTFTSSGTAITSAICAVNGYAQTNAFTVKKGEVITVIFNYTQVSGCLPAFRLYVGSSLASNSVNAAEGLNIITLTVTLAGSAVLLADTVGCATSFKTTEVLVKREYSDKYLTINFSNTCDLGDILYQDDFDQTLWFESETMETSFPTEEQGVNNGLGRFVKSFARQVKKYIARTKEMPEFMADVFYRMKLHDTIELIDTIGNENTVYNLEVEHEWLWDDKYYARFDLTFDYDESIVIGGCCNNIT